VDSDDVVEGSLATTSLPQLLATLAAEARTGVLRIDDDRQQHSETWLSDGKTYLVSTSSSPPLSEVLFGGGLANTVEAIELAISSADRASHRANGSDGAAVTIDAMLGDQPEATESLRRLLHEHNLSSLFEMLVPSDARYRFEPGCVHPLGDRFAEDTAELVDQAERRVQIWRRIAARIPSTTAVLRLAGELPEGRQERLVSAEEWRFLAQLNGTNTVADVICATGESAFRVCSTLYRLLIENVVTDSAGDRSA
jgi:hypothetical protein